MTDVLTLEYRQATAADAGAFLALEQNVGSQKLYGPASTIEQATREIAANTLFLISRNGAAVATAAYCIRPDGVAYLSNVAVQPAHRREGIARAAMAFLLQKTKAAARVELVTHPGNAAALSLYSSLGFTIEGRRENHFGDGEPRLVLALTRR